MKWEQTKQSEQRQVVQAAHIHNRFDIEVMDTRTGLIRQKAYAENIVLNGAWGQILHSAVGVDWFDKIALGTGSGTLAPTRTTLFTALTSKTAESPVFGSSLEDNYFYLRQAIVLLEYENVGAQISEVGITSSGNVLCTHALIKDMNGNVVVINKTATDIVTIYATTYVRPSTSYSAGALLDVLRVDPSTNALVCNLLGRRYNHHATYDRRSAWRYAIAVGRGREPLPTALYDYISPNADAVLDSTAKTAVYYIRIPAASANVGGIGLAMILSCSTTYTDYTQCALSRFGTGSVTQAQVVEQIGTGDDNTTDFATSFGYIPAGTVVKVDGTPVSPTIYSGLPKTKSMRDVLRSSSADYPNTVIPFGQYIPYADEYSFENPFYATYGLTHFVEARSVLYSSDDNETWTEAYRESSTGTTVYTREIPAGHQNKRYYKITANSANDYKVNDLECSALNNFKNVRFSSAPATGAVITAEYTPECAAKDVNHVFDIDITVALGEYTP